MKKKQNYRTVFITTIPRSLFFFTSHVDYLAKLGFDVHLVSGNGNEMGFFLNKYGSNYHSIVLKRKTSFISDLFSLFQIIRVLIKIKPDIIHCATPKANLLGTIAGKVIGCKKIIISVFGLVQMSKKGFYKFLLDLLTKINCHFANTIWTDSKSMGEYMHSNNLAKKEKIISLHNGSVAGIDWEVRFNPENINGDTRVKLKALHNIDDRSFVFGYVGRLAKDKGFNELVEAWKTFSLVKTNIILLILGAIDERDKIDDKQLDYLRNENSVRYVGIRSNVQDYLSIMNVFVMPSYREGFGISNLEASAMGIPIISTNIPGCVDSVSDGETGLLVPVKNIRELINALDFYYNNEEMRIKHGLLGRKRVINNFSQIDLNKSLYNLYIELLSN